MNAVDDFRERHERRFGGPASLFAAPGRVNLIGEHTDYNDGFVLPMAIDRRTIVAATRGRDRALHVHSEALNANATIALDQPFLRRGDWTDYVAGVAYVTPPATGADLSIGGDLPVGAGLSSSASLELAVALALYDLAGVHPDPRALAAAGSRAEHEFVGIRSGVMDQLVCALAQPGCALLIDCRSQATRPIPVPKNAAIAVCDTGVKHALAASQYNDRREACETGARILREHGVQIDALRDLDPQTFERVGELLPHPIRERCRHVVFEDERTLEAADAFERGDLAAAGRLMNESHRSLRDLYEVSSPELDAVVEAAQSVPGVYGARMTGGGFGGSAVAMLDPDAFPALRATLERSYYEPRGSAAAVFLVEAAGGAAALK